MNLEAYRRGRLEEARTNAEWVAAESESMAAARLDEASRAAVAIIAEARADGAAQADREMAITRAHEQRRSHRIVLEARRRSYERLGSQARAGARELRSDPAYPALLDRLVQLSREQLGDGALIERDPADGGVVAGAGGRRVDYSLPALAERCLRRLGTEIEELWH
jgi:vacuolar-type H+-ATPase subunit E/Vma4